MTLFSFRRMAYALSLLIALLPSFAYTQQLNDFEDALVNTFYYGKPDEPLFGTAEGSGYSYVLPVKFARFDIHDYASMISEQRDFSGNVTYWMNYWGDDWGTSTLEREKMIVLDRSGSSIGVSDLRRSCFPDSVINRLLQKKADSLRTTWSGTLHPRVLSKKRFSYAAWQTNPTEAYEESIDLDSDGKEDMKAVYSLSVYQLGANVKARKPVYYWGNFNCGVNASLGSAWNHYYNPQTKNFERRSAPAPLMQYWTCDATQNVYYSVDRYRVQAMLYVKQGDGIAIDSAQTRCTPDGNEEVTLYGTMTPFQLTSFPSWKINSLSGIKANGNDIAHHRVSWTFPRSVIGGNADGLTGSRPGSGDQVYIQLNPAVEEMIKKNGCPHIASCSFSGQCIQNRVRVTANGVLENFRASRVTLNGKAVNAMLDPAGKTFRFGFEFNAAGDDYLLCLYNASGDSIVYPILVADVYQACKLVVDQCSAPVETQTHPTQNIRWDLPSPQENVVNTDNGVAHVIAYIDAGDVLDVEPLVNVRNRRSMRNISVSGLQAVRSDSLEQRRLVKIGPGKFMYSDFIRLDDGMNNVYIVSRIGNDSVLSSEKIFVYENKVNTPGTPFQSSSSNLFVISVGIDKYADSSIAPLHFAVKDARQVDSLFRNSATGLRLFHNTTVINLTDADATSKKILDTINHLQVKPDDMVMFFYSGHGFVYRRDFYISNYDVIVSSDKVAQTGLSSEKLNKALNDKNCNYMVFLDACQSGAALEVWAKPGSKSPASISDILYARESMSDALAGKEKVGVIFSSCSRKEESEDSYLYSNGILSEVLLRAFSNQKTGSFAPDYDDNGILTTDELQVYLYSSIGKLTQGRQHAESSGNSRNALPLYLYPH